MMFDAKELSPQLQRRSQRMTFRTTPAVFSDLYFLQEKMGLPNRTLVIEHLIRIAAEQLRPENSVGDCEERRQASDAPNSSYEEDVRAPKEYKVILDDEHGGGWMPICPVELTAFPFLKEQIQPGDLLVPVCGEGPNWGNKYLHGPKMTYEVISSRNGHLEVRRT